MKELKNYGSIFLKTATSGAKHFYCDKDFRFKDSETKTETRPVATDTLTTTKTIRKSKLEAEKRVASQPVSRVLSSLPKQAWAVIHLGCLSPDTSSNLPESSAGHTYRIPIWSCSRRGLPCHGLLPAMRCALTAPFHPYRPISFQQTLKRALA